MGGFWSKMIRMTFQLNQDKYDSYNNFITSSTCVNSFPSTPSRYTKTQNNSSNSKSYHLRWKLNNLCQLRWRMNIGLRKVFLKQEQLQQKWNKRAQNFTIWLNRQSLPWNKSWTTTSQKSAQLHSKEPSLGSFGKDWPRKAILQSKP